MNTFNLIKKQNDCIILCISVSKLFIRLTISLLLSLNITAFLLATKVIPPIFFLTHEQFNTCELLSSIFSVSQSSMSFNVVFFLLKSLDSLATTLKTSPPKRNKHHHHSPPTHTSKKSYYFTHSLQTVLPLTQNIFY